MHDGRVYARWGWMLATLFCAGVCAIPARSQNPPSPAANRASAGEKDLDAALAKVREGQFEEALAEIKRKAVQHPEWPPAQVILARMFFSVNQVAAGRRALEQAAVEAGDHPDVYLTLGGAALGDGRLSDAKLNFEKALSLIPATRFNGEKATTFRREALAGLAAVSESREDWKSTRERLTDWLELEPKNGQVRQRLGRALFRLGQADAAFEAFRQAVGDMPALEPAAVSMAWLHAQTGDSKKAEEWFEKAQKAEPKSARARLAHAAWLLDSGRAADARREIDIALELDPKSNEAQRVRALVAWHQRDLATAEAILDRLHRDAPADSVVANLLALALIDQDDKAKQSRGMQLAEVNAQQFARSPEIQATLGWALYRDGRVEPAEQKLRASVTGARTTPDIAYFLARVMVDKGQKDDARKLLQSATYINGAFAHRDEAIALLKSLSN